MPDPWNLSLTAAENVTIGGVSVAEGMNTANVNDGIRALASEVAALAINGTGFRSKAAAEAATVGAAAKSMFLGGYAQAGDGGHAFYERVDSEPSHSGKIRTLDRYISDGTTDATNGGWWEISQQPLCPKIFNASDDDAAFTALKSVVEGVSWWRDGFGVNPSEIDLRGFDYTLTSAVIIERGVHLANGKITFTEAALSGDYGLCLGLNANTGTSYTQIVENVDFAHGALTANQPAALLYVPRTFGSRFINVNCIGADDTYRTRYGFYAGRYRAWSIDILGGRYYGNECNIRVGREGDHTGLNVYPAVADHGRVMNILLCNPKGYTIGGRSEQSDEAFNIVITSETNSSNDIADNGAILGGYAFNDSTPNSGTGWAKGNCVVLHGYDVPGTEGWDQVGVITSTASGGHLTIRDTYAVSDNIQCVVRYRGIAGCVIENVKWFARGRVDVSGVSGTFQNGETITGGTSGASAVVRTVDGTTLWLQSDVRGASSPGSVGDIIDSVFTAGETLTGVTSSATGTAVVTSAGRPRLAEFEGACAVSAIRSVRNQNTGSVLPTFSSEASNIIGWDHPGATYTPSIAGDSTPGTFTYTARGGRWAVANGFLHLNAHMDWSGSSSTAGNVTVTLPGIITSMRITQRVPAAVYSGNFATKPDAVLFGGESSVRLYRTNTTTRTPGTDVPTGAGNIHLNFTAPINIAD